MSKKFDLDAELVPGVRFWAVRDAVRKMGLHAFSIDHLCSYLFAPNIRAAIREEARVGEDISYWEQLRKVREIWKQSDIEDRSAFYQSQWPLVLAFCRKLRAHIPVVQQALLVRSIIEPAKDNEGYYELGDAGRSLAAQKALRRIDRERGLALLERAIGTAASYNAQSDLTFRVGKIYLFGSLLTDRSDIGDVDLIVITERVYLKGESAEEFRRRDQRLAEKLGVPPIVAGIRTCERESLKSLQKISPYLSVAGEETLRTMLERGEPIKLVYEYKGAPS